MGSAAARGKEESGDMASWHERQRDAEHQLALVQGMSSRLSGPPTAIEIALFRCSPI